MTAHRRLLVPTLSTVAMLAVLIGLGIWQLHRLAWKEGILARIAAAERAPAVKLPPAPSPFQKVAVQGRLLTDRSALYYGAEVRDTPQGEVLGAQLIVPMARPDAPTLLVDLGWVPEDHGSLDLPTGETTVDGYVRPGSRPGWFSATDDPARRQFFTLDPPVIAAALRVGPVAPFALVALGPTPPRGWPDPAKTLPRPPNNHLQYALTWYGLAVVLVVVFVSYVRKGAADERV